jgi:hypothetical protein
MKRTTYWLIFLVIFLLLTGWVLFRLINSPEPVRADATGFRIWLWEKRALDLIVQILLVFAGTLGIAAILPVEDDDDD